SAKGQKVDLEPMLREYYEIMGWDEEGRPSKEQIEQLGLEEFVID
ncbi:MAG: hypothetical protein M0T74_13725, partial [Desulfitobacterium hafniense]|nr:hypothetical protein [Desulfitobacterium hafniense]